MLRETLILIVMITEIFTFILGSYQEFQNRPLANKEMVKEGEEGEGMGAGDWKVCILHRISLMCNYS